MPHASQVAYLTTTHTRHFHAVDHHRARAILLCHCFILSGSAGISTCCPSPTTSVLGLGPDLPWVDEPSPGNLGLSTGVFLARLSLLIPAFSLLYCPHVLSVVLLPVYNAPLPLTAMISTFGAISSLRESTRARYTRTPLFPLPARARKISDCRNHSSQSAASVTCFSPGHLRRTTTRPVSYYALFKCMAASKPTSWLSEQLHILIHLTCT